MIAALQSRNGSPVVQISHEHVGYRWATPEQALAMNAGAFDPLLRRVLDSNEEKLKPHDKRRARVQKIYDAAIHAALDKAKRKTLANLNGGRVEASEWDESKHPRNPAGESTGGEFASIGGGVSSDTSKQPDTSTPEGMAEFQKRQVNTPAFRNWFSESQVVSANGDPQIQHNMQPVVVYQGTPHGGFTEFDEKKIGDANLFGKGFYFTEDKRIAEDYTHKDANVPYDYVRKLEIPESRRIEYFKDYFDDIKAQSFHDDEQHQKVVGSVEAAKTDFLKTGKIEKLVQAGANAWVSGGPAYELSDSKTGEVSGTWLDTTFKLEKKYGYVSNPNSEVKAVYLSIKKPFDFDRLATQKDFESLKGYGNSDGRQGFYFKNVLGKVGETGPAGARLEKSLWAAKGDTVTWRNAQRMAKELHASKPQIFPDATGKTLTWQGLHYIMTDTGAFNSRREMVRNYVASLGHDGMTHTGGWNIGEKEHKVWIAFNPLQIKSATSNKGAFDPNSKNINASAHFIHAAIPSFNDFLFDEDDFASDFLAKMRAAGEKAFKVSMRALNLKPGQKLTPTGVVEDFLIKRENKLKDVPQEIYDDIKERLEEAAREGGSEADMADAVREAFDQTYEGRAETVARTETGSVYGAANNESIAQAGYNFRRWLSASDDFVRPSHQEVNGEIVAVGEPYSNGLMHPCDPDGPPEEVINCRCTEIAIADEDAPDNLTEARGANRHSTVHASAFDESQHPRNPAGSAGGGEFAPSGSAPASKGVPVFISPDVSANDKFMAKVIAAEHPSLEKYGVTVKIEPQSKPLGDFQAGGNTFSKGGHYDPATKTVMGHPDPTIMAHEMGHAEMDFALHQRARGLQDFSMSQRAEKADIYGQDNPIGLRADDRFKNPQEPRQEIHNKLLDFEHSLRQTESEAAHPTNYSKSWRKEMIFDGPQHVEHPVGYEAGTPYGGRESLLLGGPIFRHVNEAYAEFNAGAVNQALVKRGILEQPAIGYDFKKMGSKESREAFFKLRAAIHKAAKDKSVV